MTQARPGFIVGMVGLFASLGVHGDEPDWRKTAPVDKKIENLVTVMPGAANYMIEMGERYKNLYWAGRQGKWRFAEYQAEEIRDLMEKLSITRPKRAETARNFLGRVYPEILEATRLKNFGRFEKSFKRMRRQCIYCHTKNDHGFIKPAFPPKRASSPVLNME